jgi:hypothetical protein
MPNYIRSTASRNREIKHTDPTATTTSSSAAFAYRDALDLLPKGTMTRSERAVLRRLAAHEQAQRGCWPSRERMADEADCCVRTVRNALAGLHARGLIHRDRCNGQLRQRWGCKHGRTGGTHYHLNYYAMARLLAPQAGKRRVDAAMDGLVAAAELQPPDIRSRQANLPVVKSPTTGKNCLPRQATIASELLKGNSQGKGFAALAFPKEKDIAVGCDGFTAKAQPLPGRPDAYRSMADYRADSRGWAREIR